MAFAGSVYAQTATTTTSTATTTSASSTGSTNWPFGPLLGSLLGQTQSNNVCQNREARHELVTWYKQLPADQKTALQNDLKQAVSNWYNQLPQDQKDNLQSTLTQITSQTSQAQSTATTSQS